MSISKFLKGLTVACSIMFLFACAGQEEVDETPVVQDEVVEVDPNQLHDMNMRAIAETRVIYFDLDDDTVKSDAAAVLEAHAYVLTQDPNLVVTIEGHCDERGTPAYNLALGERRANAVAQALMLNGVSSSQIKTVSYGEEQPAAEGHDESAWSMNRRGVINYEG